MKITHKWSTVIKAWADGETIQYRTIGALYDDDWMCIGFPFQPNFNDPKLEWRIKPRVKTIKYRVALCKDPRGFWFTETDDNYTNDDDLENSSDFVKWVTDWKTITVDM